MSRVFLFLLVCIATASLMSGCGEGDGPFWALSDHSDESDQSEESDASDPSDTETETDTDTTAPEGCGGILSFADPSLEAVIRQAISKPAGDIFYSDVLSITELKASDAD